MDNFKKETHDPNKFNDVQLMKHGYYPYVPQEPNLKNRTQVWNIRSIPPPKHVTNQHARAWKLYFLLKTDTELKIVLTWNNADSNNLMRNHAHGQDDPQSAVKTHTNLT